MSREQMPSTEGSKLVEPKTQAVEKVRSPEGFERIRIEFERKAYELASKLKAELTFVPEGDVIETGMDKMHADALLKHLELNREQSRMIKKKYDDAALEYAKNSWVNEYFTRNPRDWDLMPTYDYDPEHKISDDEMKRSFFEAYKSEIDEAKRKMDEAHQVMEDAQKELSWLQYQYINSGKLGSK